MSLATEFNQDNLIEVSTLTYNLIERNIKMCKLLPFTEGATYQGSQKHTLRYIDTPRKYLTVSHYVSKVGGGLANSCKVDKDLLVAFNSLKKHPRRVI